MVIPLELSSIIYDNNFMLISNVHACEYIEIRKN